MMKNDKENYLLCLCHQDTKKGKDSKKVQAPHGLFVVLRLLIVVGSLIIIVVVGSVRTKTLMACMELGRTLSRKVSLDAFLFKATRGNYNNYELRKLRILRTSNAKK
jgi:hypothetical protein